MIELSSVQYVQIGIAIEQFILHVIWTACFRSFDIFADLLTITGLFCHILDFMMLRFNKSQNINVTMRWLKTDIYAPNNMIIRSDLNKGLKSMKFII
jgi:hypothetical protein